MSSSEQSYLPHEAAGRAIIEKAAARAESEIAAPATTGSGESGKKPSRTRWWALAAGSAALLALIAAGGIYLLTRRPSTVDHLVILTVPSGAEIRLNSADYGNSPVKLEQVPIGRYKLEISKDGYEPYEEWVDLTNSMTVEAKLKAAESSVPRDEQIRRLQQRAEAAFAAEKYINPYEESAFHFAERITGLDEMNQFAREMRERIRQAMHQSAKSEMARGDMASAYDLYKSLVEFYPLDEEASAAQARLEAQLSARRGELRELLQKAESALRAGYLIEPERTSAYYYTRQALARDRQNAQAQALRTQIRDRVLAASDRTFERGDHDTAVRQLQRLARLFPDDNEVRSRLREMISKREDAAPRPQDPKAMRVEGLARYRHGDFSGAVYYLEHAYAHGNNTTEVIFALAHSLMKTGYLDQADAYFAKIPPAAGESHRSAIAARGDIAMRRGDAATALARYNEALHLGGSTLYSVATLEDKIADIERQRREKAAEPAPLTIHVKHMHGGFFQGSCNGVLTVNSTNVRYDADNGEHRISANLMAVGVFLTRNEMTVQFQKRERFKASPADAERFREAVAKYQAYYATR
ncbi:MAG TPA: PEGA domain-containing protein [Blastocatellia bacterium]|nr:PEGA domain-containing protein [Blastocatellia bacterium]